MMQYNYNTRPHTADFKRRDLQVYMGPAIPIGSVSSFDFTNCQLWMDDRN